VFPKENLALRALNYLFPAKVKSGANVMLPRKLHGVTFKISLT
jgi:hypothetical protein